MPRDSAGSMFGGAGGRGTRVSISSLEGLRNAMRKDPQRDAAAAAAAPAEVAADDKKTMQGLNERLAEYLAREGQLVEANKKIQAEINEILAKRSAQDGRDWNEIKKPLDDLRNKVKNMTMDIANVMLKIDNSKLANDDFQNKLDTENELCRTVERDLIGLKNILDDTKLQRLQLEGEVESVKEELAILKKDHNDEVEELRQKIRDSSIHVEVDSQESNLAETLNKIRAAYDKLAKKNQKEADNWYQSKFENIKVEEAQNTEALQSGRSELNDLTRQRQMLELDIQSMIRMIRSLEENLKETEERYGGELSRLRRVLQGLEAEQGQLRAQLGRQVEAHQDLLNVKMKLEAEIDEYRKLMAGIFADEDRTDAV
ncbi:keratin, type I cytoskeletal 18 [Gadus morhua]|uniref:IF rod domain-containing protein n=1 Tax=Gadus morhua TaxID=8049 RepID=A0A8C4Z855_GADMO|nr:keratin, type I cytoskeletal 18-like [Gadus morhua]